MVIPPLILADASAYLAAGAAGDPAALAFARPDGQPMRRNNFRSQVWLPAMADTGLSGVHFHDLRHAGNHMVASAGAILRELMERMGHSSTRPR